MIKNIRQNLSLPYILKRMEDSEYEFYLTGSQYFSSLCVNKKSADIDFFCEDSAECEKFLRSLGFDIIPTSIYSDDLWIERVFENLYVSVHVQLIPSNFVEKKKKLQEHILLAANRTTLTKGAFKVLWRLGEIIFTTEEIE